MPNLWLINKKVIWLTLLVYLLTGLGTVWASFQGAELVACERPSADQSCSNTAATVAESKQNDGFLSATRCTPGGNDNAYHLPLKSRLRFSRTLAPSSCAVFCLWEQAKAQVKANDRHNPISQAFTLQTTQSLRQLRTIVLLN